MNSAETILAQYQTSTGWEPGDQPTGREKLANTENARLWARFRADYEALFGRAP